MHLWFTSLMASYKTIKLTLDPTVHFILIWMVRSNGPIGGPMR